MAQIIISTIDGTNGSISALFKIKDIDIVRIYNALKYKEAIHYVQTKQESGAVLEKDETPEGYQQKISTQYILDKIASHFIESIINDAQSVEHSKIYQDILSKLEPIAILEED